MSKVLDCFSFFNELDLLEVRLHELHEVVDKFVLVEATLTHSGHSKPLYYERNQHRFAEFQGQIIHIIVDDMPITPLEVWDEIAPQDRNRLLSDYWIQPNWVRERHQRDAIMRGLTNASPDDIIIIGDADEIMRRDVVSKIANNPPEDILSIWMTFYSYYINLTCKNMGWRSCRVLKKKHITTPSEIRYNAPFTHYVDDGGWHFNFLGGADAIRTKLKAYAHDEFNNDDVLKNIEARISQRKDVFGRQYQYETVPIDNSYPKYILDNLNKYKDWVYVS